MHLQPVISINPRGTKRQRSTHPLIIILLMLISVPLIMCGGFVILRVLLGPAGDSAGPPPAAAKPADDASEFSAEDELIMAIGAETYARNNVTHPDTLEFTSPIKFSLVNGLARAGGTMRAAHGSDQPGPHTYYLEMQSNGEIWLPIHFVIDGKIVWSNPELKPARPRGTLRRGGNPVP